MDRLGQRWDRRQQTYRDGREPFTAHTSIDIAAQPQVVWDFLKAPGVGVLLDHRHLKTFPVPNTPDADVGHQYCSISRTATEALAVTLWEIVEWQAPHRLVEKVLSTAVPILEATTITATDQGCQYAVSIGLRIVAGRTKTADPKFRRSSTSGQPRSRPSSSPASGPGSPTARMRYTDWDGCDPEPEDDSTWAEGGFDRESGRWNAQRRGRLPDDGVVGPALGGGGPGGS